MSYADIHTSKFRYLSDMSELFLVFVDVFGGC